MSGLHATLGLLGGVAIIVALGVRAYQAAAAARLRRENVARARALADAVHERLGWSHATDVEFETTRVFAGDQGGVAVRLAIGCTELGDWATVALRGRRWLPDGFHISLPRSYRRDPLDAEPPNLSGLNFVSDDGTGFVVAPIEHFADPAAPFAALARALGAAATPHVTPAEYSDRAPVLDADDVVAFVRASLSRAARWADATAAWQPRAGA